MKRTNPMPDPTPAGPSTPASRARVASYASGKRMGCDPTTCNRDYTEDEAIFLRAMERYKREARRPFPTLGETLEVLISLGYRRVEEPGPLPGSGG